MLDKDFLNLTRRRIPIITDKKDTHAAAGVKVNRESELFHEELCCLNDLGLSVGSYYAATDGLNSPYNRPMSGALEKVYCRRSVATKLLQVDSFVKQFGLLLHVWDAFRAIECQKALWGYFMEEAKTRLKNPSEQVCYDYVSKYCSDPNRFNPDDPSTWPTHITGGAIDLTLKRASTGELLFMGGIFDDTTEVSHTDYFERLAQQAIKQKSVALSPSNEEALRNRRILYNAMVTQGFSNYAYEWWHYDWGNQFWIVNAPNNQGEQRPEKAYYGPATLKQPKANLPTRV